MKESNAGPDEKRKMMDILSRLEKETEDDDNNYDDDLRERLQDLDLERDTHKIWSRLTEKVGFSRTDKEGIW